MIENGRWGQGPSLWTRLAVGMGAGAVMGLSLFMAGGSSQAAEGAAPADAAERQAIEQIIHDYLLSHPAVLAEALANMDAFQREEAARDQTAAIAKLGDTLYRDPDSFTGGNPDGDITIVEFFDYQCGYCKRTVDNLLKTVEEDGNIRLILKEFPILGPASITASEAAIAALRLDRDRYLDFHTALLHSKGALDKNRILQIAAESGLNTETLAAAMTDPSIQETINRSYDLAEKIGIHGTPAFIIHGELVVGELSEARLKQKVAEARSGCVSC